MTDNSWVLRGVDPESREAAIAEAERRGMSLADFLTEVLILGPEGPAEQIAEDIAAESEALLSAPPPSRENLAFRRRIEALERRLASAVGGLDAAVQELDAALIGAVARLDEAEAITGETSETLRAALADLGVNIGALRKRLTDVEDAAENLDVANDVAHADLNKRCDALEGWLLQVDSIARAAAAAEVTLNAAYGALQQAVAQDFNAFAEEQGMHLGAAVEHMRAIAENAARGADEAAARAVEALRVARMELEHRVDGHIGDTRAYLDASLEDVRLATLDASRRAEQSAEDTAIALQAACESIEQRVGEQTAQAQEQVQAALDDMRVFAYEAARRADEASARAVETLRSTREAIETGIVAQAEDLRTRMQTAFADAADRMGGLTERVVDTEQAIVRSAQQLNARLTNVEDNAHTALEATTERLRSEISAACTDMAERQRTESDRLRGEMRAAFTDVVERQDQEAARFNLVDAALARGATEVHVLRAQTAKDLETLQVRTEARLSEMAGENVSLHKQRAIDVDARLAHMLERLAEAEQETAHTRESIGADLVRVEACTVASLEKLAGDIAATTNAQNLAAQHNSAMLERGLADGRDQIAGVLARLRLVDGARAEAEHSLAAMKDEIAALSTVGVQSETTRQALAALEARVDRDLAELRARSDQALRDLQAGLTTLAAGRRADEALTQKVDDLSARLVLQESQTGEAIDRTHGLTRMMSRVTAQSADVSDQTEERLHKLEQAMTEARFDRSDQEAALETSERLAAFERRQADALDGVRAALTGFITESERRLSEIETHAGAAPMTDETLIANAIEARLTALEQLDISGQMELLRRRFEDRLTGLESRSVRALEQVAETVAHIERRYNHGGEDDTVARSA